jgi:hypothetical protein
MRRLVIYLSVAVFSFFSGLLAARLWRVSNPTPGSAANSSSKRDAPLTVSFCELEREPQLYDGKVVRVRAELYRDEVPFIYDWSCRSPKVNTLPLIYLDGLDTVNITMTRRLTPEPYQPYAFTDGEIIAVGVFKADYSDSNDATKTPHFHIILENVTLFQE